MTRTRTRWLIVASVVGLSGAAVAYWLTRNHERRSMPADSQEVAQATGDAGSGSAASRPPPKPPLEILRAISLPGAWQGEQTLVKAGHWTAAWSEAIARDADFRGELGMRWSGENDASLPIVPQRYRLDAVKPIVLPKGEPRVAEHWQFTPNDRDQLGETNWRENATAAELIRESGLRDARIDLQLSAGGKANADFRRRPAAMRDHQSLLVVLAGDGGRYAFLNRSDVVLAPHGDLELAQDQAHYRLVVADDGQRAPLPSQLAGWTTTAFVIWDGYPLDRITEPQARAMLDWLHWGGRLIISGPNSLPQPADSFLGPYLPASSQGTRELAADDIAAPFQRWNIGGVPLPSGKPWPGLTLVPHAEARISLGENLRPPLVVEREVGRGRIIVTAFSLSQSELIAWPAFDGFLNGCLMDRPARAWGTLPELFGRPAGFKWNRREESWYDPRLVSNVRFATRDAWSAKPRYAERPTIGSGVAAWTHDDLVSDAVRQWVRGEARITVPPVRIVLWLLAAYLVVLVPINWLVFRLVGRPEWAWYAAPLVAVAFTGAIVRLADLDLGFSRSSLELDVIELQPGYARGHLTRYNILYNSLGTRYTIEGDDSTFFALPFSTTGEPSVNDPDDVLTLAQVAAAGEADEAIELRDFIVASNSTAMLRTEQMHDCGGGIVCRRIEGDKLSIDNRTRFELREVELGGTGAGRIDRIAPGTSVVVDWTPMDHRFSDEGDGSPRDQVRRAAIGLGDEVLRLTAWTTTEVPDLRIRPTPTERRRETLIVAHLEYPPPAHERDANLPPPRRSRDGDE